MEEIAIAINRPGHKARAVANAWLQQNSDNASINMIKAEL